MDVSTSMVDTLQWKEKYQLTASAKTSAAMCAKCTVYLEPLFEQIVAANLENDLFHTDTQWHCSTEKSSHQTHSCVNTLSF